MISMSILSLRERRYSPFNLNLSSLC